VAGVEVPTAVDRGVAWLERKGLDQARARTDLERKVAGFLAGPSAERRAHGADHKRSSAR